MRAMPDFNNFDAVQDQKDRIARINAAFDDSKAWNLSDEMLTKFKARMTSSFVKAEEAMRENPGFPELFGNGLDGILAIERAIHAKINLPNLIFANVFCSM